MRKKVKKLEWTHLERRRYLQHATDFQNNGIEKVDADGLFSAQKRERGPERTEQPTASEKRMLKQK